jgi:DNA-binding NtrC family response regulator
MRGRICLVEDDAIMAESLCDRFRFEDFDAVWFGRAEEALTALAKERWDLVISDLRLPGLQGHELFERARQQLKSPPPFIFITGFGSIEQAVALLKAGAADFITKPFDIRELVAKAVALCSVEQPVQTARCLGISPAMRDLEATLPRVAARAHTILLSGESGVGKECVAHRIHDLAHPGDGAPFVAINCAALPDTLLEAELFGYEKGAFTGATRSKRGLFEQAAGGSLFLDELSELPLALQAKLLRAVQEREVLHLGGDRPIRVDARIICATNRDLRQRVAEGHFREDLYYRINVIELRIPPLHERKEDIPWLAQLFLDAFAREHGVERHVLAPEAERALVDHPWPGNARELKHAIERACILSEGRVLQSEDLFPAQRPASEPQTDLPLADYLSRSERDYIHEALARHRGRVGETAAALGISRKTLWEKLRRADPPLDVHE